jgi:DNA-binding NarL/FixJ family response regulator
VIKRKVFIVDDHPIVRLGMRQLIDHQPDLITWGEAETAEEAVHALRKGKPDIAIVDLSLKSSSGMDVIRLIKELYPNLPVLVVSMHDESIYAERALRAGAMGYIMKQEATEKMVAAIHRILSGEMYLSSEAAREILGPRIATRLSPDDVLTAREFEVFRMIGRGMSTREIAEQLQLSIKTVESHRAHIKEKLQLNSAFDLLHYAIQWIQQEEPR